MGINSTQIEKIALLARLELTKAEKDKFTQQLGDILDYFEKLTKLDTQDILVSNSSINFANINRSDEIKGCASSVAQKIISNFPQHDGQYIKVNKIL